MVSHGLQLRHYRHSDLDAMFRMDELCFAPNFRFSRTMLESFAQRENARVVIGELDGQLAGFCIVHLNATPRERVGYIVTLDTDPQHRRQGIATTLMRRAETQSLEAGYPVMTLHVFTGNEGAIRFYERAGYVPDGQADNFYGRDVHALVYRKPLLS